MNLIPSKFYESPLEKKTIPVQPRLGHGPRFAAHGGLGPQQLQPQRPAWRRCSQGPGCTGAAETRGGAAAVAGEGRAALPVRAALLDPDDVQVLSKVSLGRQQELVQVRGQLLRKSGAWQGPKGPSARGSCCLGTRGRSRGHHGEPLAQAGRRSSPEPGLAEPAPPPWLRSSLAGHPRAWPSPKCTPDVHGVGGRETPPPLHLCPHCSPGEGSGRPVGGLHPPTCCRPWPSGPCCGPRRGYAGGSPRVAEAPAWAPAFTSAQVAVSRGPVQPSPALFSPRARHPDVSPGRGRFDALDSKHDGTRGRQQALRKWPKTPVVATVLGHPQSRSPRLASESEHPTRRDGAP